MGLTAQGRKTQTNFTYCVLSHKQDEAELFACLFLRILRPYAVSGLTVNSSHGELVT